MPGSLQGQLHLQSSHSTHTTTPDHSTTSSFTENTPTSSKTDLRKVLYLNQPFTDNYVPSRFLEAMLHNHQLYDHTYGELLALTAPLLNKISTIFIWLCLIYSIVSTQHAASIVSALQSSESTASMSESSIHDLISTFYLSSAEQPVSQKKNLYHKLFSVVRPVFTCPHKYTTIPYLNIDLPANPLGYFLCEFKDLFVFQTTSTSLTYITIAILAIHLFLIWLGKPPQSENIKYRSSIKWKYIVKLIWSTTFILFLTTPVLISTIPIYSPTTIMILVGAFIVLTVLGNDYSNLFDPTHLTYTTETLVSFPRLAKYLSKHFNYGNTGYVHIHTHMSRTEVLGKFESVAKQITSPIMPLSPDSTTSVTSSYSLGSNGLDSETKQFEIDEHLHVPEGFSQVFAYICLVSIFAACGVYQYIHSSGASVVQSFAKFLARGSAQISFSSFPHVTWVPPPDLNMIHHVVPDQHALQDNFFVFVVFSCLLLSFPETLLYLIARAYHNRSTTLITIFDRIMWWKKATDKTTTSKNNFKPIKSSARPLYGLYIAISGLLGIIAVLLLTCHSPIQTFFLFLCFAIIAVISPLALLIFRRIPGAKRVIRGSWDYDDSNEQGSDNI